MINFLDQGLDIIQFVHTLTLLPVEADLYLSINLSEEAMIPLKRAGVPESETKAIPNASHESLIDRNRSCSYDADRRLDGAGRKSFSSRAPEFRTRPFLLRAIAKH